MLTAVALPTRQSLGSARLSLAPEELSIAHPPLLGEGPGSGLSAPRCRALRASAALQGAALRGSCAPALGPHLALCQE